MRFFLSIMSFFFVIIGFLNELEAVSHTARVVSTSSSGSVSLPLIDGTGNTLIFTGLYVSGGASCSANCTSNCGNPCTACSGCNVPNVNPPCLCSLSNNGSQWFSLPFTGSAGSSLTVSYDVHDSGGNYLGSLNIQMQSDKSGVISATILTGSTEGYVLYGSTTMTTYGTYVSPGTQCDAAEGASKCYVLGASER